VALSILSWVRGISIDRFFVRLVSAYRPQSQRSVRAAMNSPSQVGRKTPNSFGMMMRELKETTLGVSCGRMIRLWALSRASINDALVTLVGAMNRGFSAVLTSSSNVLAVLVQRLFPTPARPTSRIYWFGNNCPFEVLTQTFRSSTAERRKIAVHLR